MPLTKGAGILDGVDPINDVGVPGRAEEGEGKEDGDPGDNEWPVVPGRGKWPILGVFACALLNAGELFWPDSVDDCGGGGCVGTNFSCRRVILKMACDREDFSFISVECVCRF